MPFTVDGIVTSGFGRGKEFTTLEGYARQFRERLGYEPYPGTLNIDLYHSIGDRLDRLDPIRIDSWEDGDRSFGIVYCYPASVITDDSDPAMHVVDPKRTDHDNATIELISDTELRSHFDLSDGDALEIRIRSSTNE